MESIRKDIDASLIAHPEHLSAAIFQQFSTISLDELDNLTQAFKQTTLLAPVPTKVLKELCSTL